MIPKEMMTPNERATAERQEAICARYLELRERHRDEKKATPTRLMREVAKEFGITDVGVRYILKKHGLYTPKKENDHDEQD